MTEQLPESIMLHGLPGEGARQTSVEQPIKHIRTPTTPEAHSMIPNKTISLLGPDAETFLPDPNSRIKVREIRYQSHLAKDQAVIAAQRERMINT